MIDTAQQVTAIEKIKSAYPDSNVQLIQLYSEGLSIHKVFLSERRYAWHDQRGNQLQVWTANQRVEDWLLDLHHRFLLGMPLLLVGLFLWWPWRRSFKLIFWPRTSQRPNLMRAHTNLGAVFCLPIMLTVLTGVILVYPSESRFVLVDKFGDSSPPLTQTVTIEETPFSWRNALTLVTERFPEAQVRWVSTGTEHNAQAVVGIQQAKEWNRLGMSSIRFSSQHDILINDALRQPMAERVFEFSYPLHTAKLGFWYRLLLSSVGLALAGLCLFGLFSFTRKAQGQHR